MSLTTYNNVTIPSFMYGRPGRKRPTGLVLQAVEAGFTAIDTANQLVHYDEARVGEALLQLATQGITRDKLFLQTKFTPVNGQDHRLPYDARASITTQVEQSFASSLEHLHTDYLDSYVLHGPYSRRGLGGEDWEVWAAIESLYDAGKTTTIGISNVSAEQLTLLCTKAKEKRLLRLNFAVRPPPELVESDPQRQLGDLAGPGFHLDAVELARINLLEAQLAVARHVGEIVEDLELDALHGVHGHVQEVPRAAGGIQEGE